MLWTSKEKDSETLLENCRAAAMAEYARGEDTTVLGRERNSFNSWATIAVRHGVDAGRWPAAVALPAGDLPLLGRFELTYGQLLSSRNDPHAATAALSKLRRDRQMIGVAMPRERPDDHDSAPWLDRAVAQGEAIVELAKGRTERGLQLLEAAAAAEAALPQPYGPPILAKPSAELLGDEYLALGRKADAAKAYRQVLAAMPRRRLPMVRLEGTAVVRH